MRRFVSGAAVVATLVLLAAACSVGVDTARVEDPGAIDEPDVAGDDGPASGPERTRSDPAAPTAVPTEAYPPPRAEFDGAGVFLVRCDHSHSAQEDPIVSPGPPGTPSNHLHDFWGNTTVDASSTFTTLIGDDATTCGVKADRAGYWAPALINPDGSQVRPDWNRVYYRNRPDRYGATTIPPDGFRMVAQHDMSSFGDTITGWWWNCHDRDTDSVQFTEPPTDCGADDLVNLTIIFPACWDGVRLDSHDHASHVTYSTGNHPTSCPSSHPVKIPNIRYAIQYDGDGVQPGAQFAKDGAQPTGGTIPHADFFMAWQIDDPNAAVDEYGFRSWLEACTLAGRRCGTVSDGQPLPR